MADVMHCPRRVGPGVPTCSCGEVFEWDYELSDHIKRKRRDEDPAVTATDTAALAERIRRARSVPAEWARLREGETTMEQIERHQRRMDEQTAALVAEEVRAAKAEAWDEGHSWGWADYEDHAGALTLELDAMPSRAEALTMRNPYRETGDPGEH